MLIGKTLLINRKPTNVEILSDSKFIAEYLDPFGKKIANVACSIDWAREEISCKTIDNNEIIEEFKVEGWMMHLILEKILMNKLAKK